MAISKKGSRKIVVGGNTFLWKIRKYPTHNERHNVDYLIPVQHIDGGQILLVNLGFNRSGYALNPISSVTPSIIAECISKAIGNGWDFKSNQSPMTIDCTEIPYKRASSLTEMFINVVSDMSPEYQFIIDNTKSMLDAGEYQIALEVAIDNILEDELGLTDELIDMAREAFSIYRNEKYEQNLRKIKDQGMNV